MYDFDAERAKKHAERSREFGEKPFKFGGETFYVRANVGYLAIKRIAALSESSAGDETFSAIEHSVISMIDPRDGAHEKFLEVTQSVDDPVTFEDLVDLHNWLLGETSGRPPTQDPASSSSPTPTGTSSTEDSSTEQEGVSKT